jgi:hypothetical protein
MQHIQSENISNAVRAEGKLLRIGNSVEPWAPNQIRRHDPRRILFEKARPRPDFHRNAVRLSSRQHPRKKFFSINAPQNGFLLPNAAMPLKLLLSLRIDGHGAFFDCTESRDRASGKARHMVSRGN